MSASPKKIAFVTGGSRGLGRSICLHLADCGVDSVFTYLSNRDAADEVVREIESRGAKAAVIQLDGGDSSQYERAANELASLLKDKFGTDKFDFLVNNAGHGLHASIDETTEEDFDRLVDVHFKSTFFLTRKLSPMIRDGTGRIVNITTGLTRFCFPGYAAYGSVKGAVDVLTRFQAMELGPRGITVNSIAPGAIETDFGGGAIRDIKELNELVAKDITLGRCGLPDDVGGCVASFLTGGNGWVNAQRIEVSGGQKI